MQRDVAMGKEVEGWVNTENDFLKDRIHYLGYAARQEYAHGNLLQAAKIRTFLVPLVKIADRNLRIRRDMGVPPFRNQQVAAAIAAMLWNARAADAIRARMTAPDIPRYVSWHVEINAFATLTRARASSLTDYARDTAQLRA